MKVHRMHRRRIDAVTGVDMSWVAEMDSRVVVNVARYAPGDSLPRHPAPSWQVFAVARGRGHVAGGDDVRVPVSEGDVVVWEPGEHHTSWAETAMTVVVVQTREEPTVPAGT